MSRFSSLSQLMIHNAHRAFRADFNRCVSVLLSTIARKKGQTPEVPVFLDMVVYGDLKANQGFTFLDIVSAAERSGKIERSASGILTIRMD